MEYKTSYRSSLWNLRPLVGTVVCGIYDLILEQFVKYVTSYRSSLWKQSKEISNDQELIQSDPTSCPQNQREITKYIN